MALNNDDLAATLLLLGRAYDIKEQRNYGELLAILESLSEHLTSEDILDANEALDSRELSDEELLDEASKIVGNTFFDLTNADGCLRVLQTKDGVLVEDNLYTLNDNKLMDGDKHIYWINFTTRVITYGADM